MTRQRVDLTPAQIDHLKTLVSGQVSTNETVLDQHGRDESAIPPVRPSAVVMPQSTEEVAKVLAYCNQEKIPVVAFGAGSSLEGHVLPLFGGISLDLTEMNKVIEVRADDLLVDPGADATLGGMASTGAAGTTTVRYGSMRDNVLAMTAVLADGTIVKTGRETRKLSAGYDLTRLLVGSEGTLAVITELTLRVFGIPEKMAAAIVRFPTLADGVTAATAIVRSGISIARCEFLDSQCIKNVNAHDGLSLTEVPTLFFEFHGSPQGVQEDANSVKDIVEEFGGSEFEWTTDEGARRKLWQARHNAYWAGIAANPGKRAVSTDAAVPLSKLADAVTVADQVLSKHKYPYSILGHVADANFHCFIVTDPDKPEELQEVRHITHEITMKMIEMGGTCTGEHGIGSGKIDALIAETGAPAVNIMKSIKQALDPNNILNPGKVFN
jgi:D-lactate dehydrogenase (cytochrome)